MTADVQLIPHLEITVQSRTQFYRFICPSGDSPISLHPIYAAEICPMPSCCDLKRQYLHSSILVHFILLEGVLLNLIPDEFGDWYRKGREAHCVGRHVICNP